MNFFSKLFTEKYKLEKEREKLVSELNRIKENRRKIEQYNRGKRFERRASLKSQEREERILTEINSDIRKVDIKLAMYLLKPHLTNDEITILQQYL